MVRRGQHCHLPRREKTRAAAGEESRRIATRDILHARSAGMRRTTLRATPLGMRSLRVRAQPHRCRGNNHRAPCLHSAIRFLQANHRAYLMSSNGDVAELGCMACQNRSVKPQVRERQAGGASINRTRDQAEIFLNWTKFPRSDDLRPSVRASGSSPSGSAAAFRYA